MQKKPGRILIIKPSALGDVAMVLPALDSLRKCYPQAKISWLVRKEFAPFLEGHPQIDEILIFDRKLLGNFWRSLKAVKAFWKFILELRSKKFDMVIDFQGLFRSGLFSYVTGAEKRIGMTAAREGATIFYNKKVLPDSNSVHVLDYYFKLVQAAGAKSTQMNFNVHVDVVSADWWQQLAQENGINLENYAVLVPGASKADKCWSVENFAAISDWLNEKYGLDIVIIGSKSESVIAEKIQELTSAEIHNLAGKSNLKELRAILKSSKLTVSNDTGPAHISFMAGIKTFVIFGTTNPKRLGPYGKKDWSICAEYDRRGGEIKKKIADYSIDRVTVDMVMERIEKYM